jgi:allene oxide cyclase
VDGSFQGSRLLSYRSSCSRCFGPSSVVPPRVRHDLPRLSPRPAARKELARSHTSALRGEESHAEEDGARLGRLGCCGSGDAPSLVGLGCDHDPVVEHATTDKVADVGKTGDSPGDLLTFHDKVYDEADTTVVGRDKGYCVRISPKKGSWECIYTTFLEDGSITVETPFYDAADSVGAITGGSGAYASAHGSIDLHCFVDDGAAKCNFVFNIA